MGKATPPPLPPPALTQTRAQLPRLTDPVPLPVTVAPRTRRAAEGKGFIIPSFIRSALGSPRIVWCVFGGFALGGLVKGLQLWAHPLQPPFHLILSLCPASLLLSFPSPCPWHSPAFPPPLEHQMLFPKRGFPIPSSQFSFRPHQPTPPPRRQ